MKTLRIFRGNKLLGIENISEMSDAVERATVAKKYKRYNRYFLVGYNGKPFILVKKGYDSRVLRGKSLIRFNSKNYVKYLKK